MYTEEQFYRLERQQITLEKLDREGWILDIGGGGEGIIGQLMREQVIAIDPVRRELEEAPKGALKVIMDARELQFLDNTFHTVTSFFCTMYIDTEDHRKVFQEIYRVMKPGGEFYLWDVIVPPYGNDGKEVFIIPLSINMNGKTIQTGYGTIWAKHVQDAAYYAALAADTGFKAAAREEQEHFFFLRLKK